MYYYPKWRKPDIEVPNLPIDLNSWGRLACYPSNNFYLLSDDRCLYIRRLIFVQPEETFAHFSYVLGDLHPIEIVYLRLSLGL